MKHFEELPGPWEVTSSADWCEENWKVENLPFPVAEFWNTVSNLPLLSLSIYGAYICLQRGYPMRVVICYLLAATVALGSAGFHGTLTREWQLMDEIPMILCTAALIMCAEPWPIPRLAEMVTLLSIGFTIVYVWVYTNIIFHQVFYAGMIAIYAYFFRQWIRDKSLDRNVRHRAATLFKIGTATYGLGFVCWLIDNNLCTSLLRPLRHKYPTIAPLFQFHAHWHILTAIGTYANITTILYLRLIKYRKNVQVNGWVLPTIHEKYKS